MRSPKVSFPTLLALIVLMLIIAWVVSNVVIWVSLSLSSVWRGFSDFEGAVIFLLSLMLTWQVLGNLFSDVFWHRKDT
ncbi:MAG: hypothetical protein ACPG8W_17450 [Candidatus Promineifilaceae bacterium]